MLVNALTYNGSCNNIEFGVLTGSCHLLLCPEPSLKIVFVRRHANGVVYALSRQSCYEQNRTARYDVPSWLEKELRDCCIVIDH